jgi:hypothetical protein
VFRQELTQLKWTVLVESLGIAIVLLPVLLVAGLWQARGEPLFPRIIDAGITMLMTAWLIHLLRKTKISVVADSRKLASSSI